MVKESPCFKTYAQLEKTYLRMLAKHLRSRRKLRKARALYRRLILSAPAKAIG